MKEYLIGIIDDEFEYRESMYKTLFSEQGVEFEHISEKLLREKGKRSDFFSKYHCLIIDVWLSNHDEFERVTDILPLIGNKAPIIFVSSQMDKKDTLDELHHNQLKKFENIYLESISLGDFFDDKSLKDPDSSEIIPVGKRIIKTLNTFYRVSSYNIPKNSKITILHLSDPQFGDPDFDSNNFLMESSMHKLFDQTETEIDFIIITGDITYSGKRSEFELAYDWTERLMRKIWHQRNEDDISRFKERLFIVPGNHDVDLDIMAGAFYKYDFKKEKYVKRNEACKDYDKLALTEFKKYAFKVTNDIRWKESEDLCWVNESFLHIGLRFFVINSVPELNSYSTENTNKASVLKSSLQRITDEHQTPDQDIFSICISHYGQPTNNVEGIRNWQDMESFFGQNNIKLFLHGHGHDHDVKFETSKTRDRTVTLVHSMAQSSHLSKTMQSNDSLRGFSLIMLGRKNGIVNEADIMPYEFRRNRDLRSTYSPVAREEKPIYCLFRPENPTECV